MSFVLAGFALTGSPGPATLTIAATGAAFGARRGVGLVCGGVLGVGAVMALIATGVVGLVLAAPGMVPLVGAAAAVYIAYLAYRIATAPPLAEAGARGRAPSLASGFMLGIANPKAYAAMAALFSGFVLLGDRPAFDALLKGAILLVIVVVVDVTWLLVGAALTRRLRSRRLNRAVNLTFAALLLASIGFALLI